MKTSVSCLRSPAKLFPVAQRRVPVVESSERNAYRSAAALRGAVSAAPRASLDAPQLPPLRPGGRDEILVLMNSRHLKFMFTLLQIECPTKCSIGTAECSKCTAECSKTTAKCIKTTAECIKTGAECSRVQHSKVPLYSSLDLSTGRKSHPC